jgi:NADH:ubiquinone oxidoreductase subunit 3 (subunit A)
MPHEWLYLGIFLTVAVVVPVLALVIAGILSPKKPNPIKNSTYECGMETVGPSWVQFKVQYYIYGLIFLVFDVETVLLTPGLWLITGSPFLASSRQYFSFSSSRAVCGMSGVKGRLNGHEQSFGSNACLF